MIEPKEHGLKVFYARNIYAEFRDWELFEGTREAAIEEAKREFSLMAGDTITIADAEPMQDFLDISGDFITEIIHNAADVCVEDCEWPNLSTEQENELGDAVTKVIREYFAKNNLNHDFNAIINAVDIIV